MLSAKSTALLFILIVLSFINNAKSFDYNSAVGLGLIFISSKNPFLHRMYYFYMIIILTILADAFSIALLCKNLDVFHAIIVPVLQILIKGGVFLVQVLKFKRQNQQKEQKNQGKLEVQPEQNNQNQSKLSQQKKIMQKRSNLRPEQVYDNQLEWIDQQEKP